jgi:hypothetical protein
MDPSKTKVEGKKMQQSDGRFPVWARPISNRDGGN